MPPTLLLGRTDIAELVTIDDCLAAVEFGVPGACGGSDPAAGHPGHSRGAELVMSRPCFAAKTKANFPGNPARSGLPAIQGVVELFDAANGALLAAWIPWS